MSAPTTAATRQNAYDTRRALADACRTLDNAATPREHARATRDTHRAAETALYVTAHAFTGAHAPAVTILRALARSIPEPGRHTRRFAVVALAALTDAATLRQTPPGPARRDALDRLASTVAHWPPMRTLAHDLTAA